MLKNSYRAWSKADLWQSITIEGCAANEATLQGRVATRKPGPGRKEEAAMSFGGLWPIPREKWHRPPPLTFGGLWRRPCSSRIHATA
jgi:hypothetical protein